MTITETIKSTSERINISRAKQIVGIDNATLIKHLDQDHETGIKYKSLHASAIDIKRYCLKHIKNGGAPMQIDYKFSDNMVTDGRLWSKSTSFQKMNRKVRGYLCQGNYYDIDMVNAQPTLLYRLLHKYYKDHNDWKYLKSYCKSRETVLKNIDPTDRDNAKNMIIVCMNSSQRTSHDNSFLKGLDNEFKLAQRLLWDEPCEITKQLECYKGLNKINKYGSYLNMILSCFENCVLQNTIKQFDSKYLSTLIMDGFHLDTDIDKSVDEIIDICNRTTKEWGISWSHKEFDHTLDYFDDIELTEDQDRSYDTVKQEFEEDHFMIESPVIFGREYEYNGKPTYGLYNRQDFKTICMKYSFMDIDAKGKPIEKDFLEQWLKDDDIRCYKQLDFNPVKNENSEFYNTFLGFDCESIPFEDRNETAVDIFNAHISHLVDHETKSIEYLTSYLADIIQNPDKSPNIAILMKSPQGFGKDLLIDIISAMINERYLCRTEEIKDVLGNFNTPIKDKVICQINELAGKDGWEYREKLKGLITTKTININEKGIKHYKQKNSLRIFVFSNRTNPIEISQDDRRFVVFKANYKKPSTEYFDRLVAILNDKSSLYSIFDYLKNYKITINLRTDRPVTKAYEDMRESNINPLYRFLNDVFVNKEIDEHFGSKEYRKHKKSGAIIIQSQKLFDSFSDYLIYNQLEYITPNFKNIKQLLTNINVVSKKYKIDGVMVMCYAFDTDVVISTLNTMNIVDDIEELNDDEWE